MNILWLTRWDSVTGWGRPCGSRHTGQPDWLVSAMLTLTWENSLVRADAAMSHPFFTQCNSSPVSFAVVFLDCLSSMCRPWYFKEHQLVVSVVDFFASRGLLDLKKLFHLYLQEDSCKFQDLPSPFYSCAIGKELGFPAPTLTGKGEYL